ncbi:uncharacterized protein N0V89_008929 [Didymosphaeria variabile]|uniref:Azaphilone pigments biosynthesis cluster protein L N-terminal domain-containing protein n=1 Tax=Didymosphaeria variabile TaxID=1932322 RepID=A0A9W8XHD5_9PLEO|nr:uncharacterized protein N0V89_008929 [Didymosphaeria variabile]KAJ4350308.1 hypothetical protein N0V89_008929 [Didymosphaeria variabile]
MVDPLSITVSVVGITTAALQSIQFLIQTIDKIKDDPDTIKGVSTDLHVIQPVLQNLVKLAQDNSSPIILSEQITHAHWLERSTEDKIFWIDRWRVGLFGLERIKTFRAQLSDCKGTLSIALSTATIITTSRQEHLMQEMKDMMLQQNELVIQQQIARADVETREIQLRMQQLPAGNDNELATTTPQLRECEPSRGELLHELGKRHTANQSFIKMCEEALSQTHYQRTGEKLKGVRATNNSSTITGFINTSGEESKIDQDISDVTADNFSIAVAGVVKNLDFKNLRPSGPDKV